MIRSPSARTGFVAIAAIAAASCSSAPPPPPPVAPAITVAAQPHEEAPPPPSPNVDPVPAPEGLIALARIGSPAQDLAIWSQILPPSNPLNRAATLGADTLMLGLFGSIGAEVDTSLPADVAMLEGEPGSDPIFVGSVVLRDLAAARKLGAADFDFRDTVSGGVVVTPRPGAKNAGAIGRDDLACRIYPGGEPILSHLVCAASPKSLASAGPYLARTVTRAPTAPGVSIEIAEGFLSQFLASMPSDTRPDDPGSRKMAMTWIDLLKQDFASIGLMVSGSGQGVTAGLDLRFRSVKSPLSAVALEAPARAAPSILWRIPADADIGIALPGAAPDALRTALGPTFWPGVRDLMKEDVPAQNAEGLAAESEKLFFTGGPIVFAHGPSAPQSTPAKPATDPAKRYAEARASAAGWMLFAMNEPASRWTSGLRQITKLGKGTKPSARAATDLPSSSVTSEVPLRASDKLPKGTLHLVDRRTPNAGYQPKSKRRSPLEGPYDVHIFVGGDESATWIVISENEALARSRIAEVLAPGAAGISGRSELAPMKSLPPGGIGFATIQGVHALFEDESTSDEIAAAAQMRATFRRLPGRGSEPMFLSIVSAQDEQSGGVTLRITALLSMVAAADLGRISDVVASSVAAAASPSAPPPPTPVTP